MERPFFRLELFNLNNGGNHETIKRSSTENVRNLYKGSHPNRTGKENSMNIIEQTYEQIVKSDWLKYFEIVKKEGEKRAQSR